MTSRELHEESLRRHSAHIVAANEETRRRMWDAENRWSTTSQAGGTRGFIREDYQMKLATAVNEDLDHHPDFVYKAHHFIWTFKCSMAYCNWQMASHTEMHRCQQCNATDPYKYLTFNSTWRQVSEWYVRSPCDQWFFFCSQCKQFLTRSRCCGCECVDVYALKRDQQVCGRL